MRFPNGWDTCPESPGNMVTVYPPSAACRCKKPAPPHVGRPVSGVGFFSTQALFQFANAPLQIVEPVENVPPVCLRCVRAVRSIGSGRFGLDRPAENVGPALPALAAQIARAHVSTQSRG